MSLTKAADASRFERLAKETSDPDLKVYYRERAAKAREENVSPVVQALTREYVAKLRQAGADIPSGVVEVEIRAA